MGSRRVDAHAPLPDLLHELGFTARAFVSAEEFPASDCIGQTQCLILDVECLFKPFSDTALLAALETALHLT